MINLSYKFDQNSSCLELSGLPDVSNGDSEETIGILSSWKLKIIGEPLLEGQKEHLDYLMQVILMYSRSYMSGIRKKFVSKKNIVTITPSGINHKLKLNSSRKDVQSLEIELDDSELSDLTRCFDLLRFDPRFNLKWDLNYEKPYTRRYIRKYSAKSKINLNFINSLIIFITASTLLLLIPITNKYQIKDTNFNKNYLDNSN